MESYTQLGLAGLTLGILFFVVRYFVQAMNKKDEVIIQQHKELQGLTVRSIEATNKFTEAVTLNTNAAKQASEVAQKTADISQKNAETMTKLMVKVMNKR